MRFRAENEYMQVAYNKTEGEEGNTIFYNNETGEDVQLIHTELDDLAILDKGIENHCKEVLGILTNAYASNQSCIERAREYFIHMTN